MEYSRSRTPGTCLSSANNALEAVCAVEEWSGEERTVNGDVIVDKTKGGYITFLGEEGLETPEKAEKRGQKGEGGGGPGKGQTE